MQTQWRLTRASNFVQGKYDGSLEDAFHVAEVVDAALLQAGRLLVLLVLLHLLHHPLKVVRVIIFENQACIIQIW